MKKILILQLIAVALVLFSGCANDESLIDSQVTNEDVNFAFYDIYMEEIGHIDSDANTRATQLKKSSYFKYLTVALFPLKADTVYRYTQTSTDSDYGSLSVKIPTGKYVLVALATAKTSVVSIVSPSEVNFSNNNVPDNVYTCDTIEVKGGSSNTISCLLKRAVAGFAVKMTNQDLSGLSKITVEIEGNCSSHFSPADGLSTVSEGYSRISDISSVNSASRIGNYLFLCSDQENVNATIKLFDSYGNVVKTKVFTDVVLKRNYLTTYTGDIVSMDKSFSFQIEDETFKSSGYDKTFDD